MVYPSCWSLVTSFSISGFYTLKGLVLQAIFLDIFPGAEALLSVPGTNQQWVDRGHIPSVMMQSSLVTNKDDNATEVQSHTGRLCTLCTLNIPWWPKSQAKVSTVDKAFGPVSIYCQPRTHLCLSYPGWCPSQPGLCFVLSPMSGKQRTCVALALLTGRELCRLWISTGGWQVTDAANLQLQTKITQYWPHSKRLPK